MVRLIQRRLGNALLFAGFAAGLDLVFAAFLKVVYETSFLSSLLDAVGCTSLCGFRTNAFDSSCGVEGSPAATPHSCV